MTLKEMKAELGSALGIQVTDKEVFLIQPKGVTKYIIVAKGPYSQATRVEQDDGGWVNIQPGDYLISSGHDWWGISHQNMMSFYEVYPAEYAWEPFHQAFSQVDPDELWEEMQETLAEVRKENS